MATIDTGQSGAWEVTRRDFLKTTAAAAAAAGCGLGFAFDAEKAAAYEGNSAYTSPRRRARTVRPAVASARWSRSVLARSSTCTATSSPRSTAVVSAPRAQVRSSSSPTSAASARGTARIPLTPCSRPRRGRGTARRSRPDRLARNRDGLRGVQLRRRRRLLPPGQRRLETRSACVGDEVLGREALQCSWRYATRRRVRTRRASRSSARRT